MDNDNENENMNKETPDIREDSYNFALLILLYTLQTVPQGLIQSISFIMQEKRANYKQQAEFYFASYASSMKLLWAPIVDGCYWTRMGRRKTWVIFSQYATCLSFLVLSKNVDNWLPTEGTIGQYQLIAITLFCSKLFSTTQDIAVDAWAASLLKKKNVGYSCVASQIGKAIGLICSYTLFTTLNSAEFCNRFRKIPQNVGLISLSDFISILVIVYFTVTTFIFIYKRDNTINQLEEDDIIVKKGLIYSYSCLWKIMHIKPFIILCVILITSRMHLGPIRQVTQLKLVEFGLKPDEIARFELFLLPLQITVPLCLSNYIVGAKCVKSFLTFTLINIIGGIVFTVFVSFASYVKENNSIPLWYYILIVVIYSIDQLIIQGILISITTFCYKISDPICGGVYITFLNGVKNLSNSWPETVCLYLMTPLTINYGCEQKIDGFYMEMFLFSTFSFIWLCIARKVFYHLEKLDISAWTIKGNSDTRKQGILITKNI